MRGIWTQASRPSLRGSHQLSSVDSFNSTLVRKTTTRPPRRRPNFCEHVFTVLITPVLAAALFVDTSWKSKQRRDWDEKLAAINDEIDQLKEREHRLKSSYRSRNVRHVLYQQQRGYSSAAHAVAETQDEELPAEIEIPLWEEDNAHIHEHSLDEKLPIRNVVAQHEFSPERLADIHRYHRLNAITLALRMLLHIRIGTHSIYSVTSGHDPVDEAVLGNIDDTDELSLPRNTEQIARMLALTRKRMLPLRNLEDLYSASPIIQKRANQGNLHGIIQRLTAEFENGRVSLIDLVEGYGSALLQSKEVPGISVYIMLIRALSRTGSSSLAYQAAAALKNSTLRLSDPAIFYILLQIGQARDSRSFSHLLQQVVKSDNPINVINTWEKTRVHGMDLPVPTSLNPRLLMGLVFAALKCEQPDRAEAWLSLLREADYGSMWKDNVFKSFLAFYSTHGNWEQGQRWLQKSVHHAVSIANQSIDRLARVIYRMLDLCVRCRKLPEYTTILEAAVDSGIGPPLVDKSKQDRRPIHPRTRSILLEWESLPLSGNSSECSKKTKAQSFQYACRSLIAELSGKPPSSTKGRPEAEEDELVMMGPSPLPSHQQYAVRRRGDPIGQTNASRDIPAEKVTRLQTRLAQQDNLISEMKARFDLAFLRQKSFEEEAATRAREYVESTVRLEADVRTTLLRFEALGTHYTKQEAKISELKSQSEAATKARDHDESTVRLEADVREALLQIQNLRSRVQKQEATIFDLKSKVALAVRRDEVQSALLATLNSTKGLAQLRSDVQEWKEQTANTLNLRHEQNALATLNSTNGLAKLRNEVQAWKAQTTSTLDLRHESTMVTGQKLRALEHQFKELQSPKSAPKRVVGPQKHKAPFYNPLDGPGNKQIRFDGS